jgi:hypothetical protein
LGLAYGVFRGDDRDEFDAAGTAAIGQEVAATLRRHGLRVDWAGNVDRRIKVGLIWQRRRISSTSTEPEPAQAAGGDRAQQDAPVMDYTPWVDLFGRAADDLAVRGALARAGVTETVRIERDELSEAVDLPQTGMTVEFTDESILRPEGGKVRRPILTSVLMIIQHRKMSYLYEGALPCGLVRETSRDAMRARLGSPVKSNEKLRWDEWTVDGLTLSVSYPADFSSITRVGIRLPGDA